jgi:hypothetical protein
MNIGGHASRNLFHAVRSYLAHVVMVLAAPVRVGPRGP